MSWIDDSIGQYYNWLKERTSYKTDEQSGWSSISTPFIGLFNDPIEIYVKMNPDNTISMSDDGQTLNNLELAGVPISRSQKRKEWLEYILLNYGILLKDNELLITANATNFAQKKHNLICAISEISDMEVMAKHLVSSLFKEDVKSHLDEQEVIYTPQYIMKGNTGLDFTFDFQIAGRTNEVVIKSFNSLNKTNVPNFLFSWNDIKDIRERVSGKELKGLAIINDTNKEAAEEFISAFESKGADYMLWSERGKPENIAKLREVA